MENNKENITKIVVKKLREGLEEIGMPISNVPQQGLSKPKQTEVTFDKSTNPVVGSPDGTMVFFTPVR